MYLSQTDYQLFFKPLCEMCTEATMKPGRDHFAPPADRNDVLQFTHTHKKETGSYTLSRKIK